jgi:hypothetical protein
VTEPSSLEGRVAQLESTVRSLMASNWTDRASVVDAAGNAVQLSSLAFGQVADLWSGIGVMNVSGVLNQSTPPWIYPGHPSVTVLVRGGRLRVDWSALMALNGGNPAAPFAASWAYSYRVVYTGPEGAPGTVSTQVVDPDYYRAIMVRDTSATGTGVYVEAANWALHTGLTPGWYKVEGAWRLGYSAASSGSTPQGFTDNPRIAATPL